MNGNDSIAWADITEGQALAPLTFPVTYSTLAKDVAERLRDHSWFIAFAPVDAPRIALAVLVENGGFGASAAGPIARKVMDAYLLPHMPAAKPAPGASP